MMHGGVRGVYVPVGCELFVKVLGARGELERW